MRDAHISIEAKKTAKRPSITMTRIGGTDFFYYSKHFELNARLDYKFVADGSWILDPENPHKVYGGYGPNSELAMPPFPHFGQVFSSSSGT